MLRSHRTIAIDIGASKVVVAEFNAFRTGVPQLMNYGIAQLGVESEGEVDSSAYIVSAIREIMRERKIRPGPLVMTVSGQAVFPRYVKLPPVGKDKLLDIIHYEAEQNVPFPIDEVVWDYQLVGGEETGERNVMLVAVKIENVSRLTDCVTAVGLDPEIVDVAPMALYNTVRYNYPDLQDCTMILDVGARSSTLIFVEPFKIYSRSVPVAGNAITQEVMKEFELPFAEAEKLKIEHAFVALGGVYGGPENAVADRVSKIVRSVVTRLHAEVNRSINFYRSQQGGSLPSRVLLAGGSSIIPHFDTFFREKLKVDVAHLNPFANIGVSDRIEAARIERDLHLLGEVSGLSLRRSLSCPVEINLMPPKLAARRLFRKRQPFFALAAVGFVLILLCWWVYFLRMREMLGTLSENVSQRTGNLKEKASAIRGVKEQENAVRQKVDQIAGLISLRTQWIEMLDAVHSCMLDGMWLTELKPEVEGDAITRVEISGRGFLDKLMPTDPSQMTAPELLMGRLRQLPYFSEQSEITRMPVVRPGDYAQDFTLRLVLKKPLGLR